MLKNLLEGIESFKLVIQIMSNPYNVKKHDIQGFSIGCESWIQDRANN